MAGNRSLNRRGGLAAIIAALVLAALIPTQVAAATRPITFDLELGNACLWGRASDSATVNYVWRDASGALILSGQATANESGYFATACATDGRGIRPGDRVRASDGNSTRKFVIPQLSLVLNRVKDVIKGTGPAGTRVHIEYLYPAGPVPDVVGSNKTITVGSDGKWKLSTRHRLYIIGGSGAFLSWKSKGGHRIYLSSRASMIEVTIGRAGFSGIGKAYTRATIAVRDGVTGELRGTGATAVDARGNFASLIRDASGQRVMVAAGDRIKSNVAGDAGFLVPDIEATGDPATDHVSGKCYDTGRYAGHVQVQVYRNGFQRGWATFNTAEDGLFNEPMTDAFPKSSVIKHGDELLVRCQQVNGDYVQKWFAVP